MTLTAAKAGHESDRVSGFKVRCVWNSCVAMDPIDTAPDSWDQEDDGEAQVDVQLSKALSTTLNVDAKPFVPNVHAAEFIPSFRPKGSSETVESAGEFPVI